MFHLSGIAHRFTPLRMNNGIQGVNVSISHLAYRALRSPSHVGYLYIYFLCSYSAMFPLHYTNALQTIAKSNWISANSPYNIPIFYSVQLIHRHVKLLWLNGGKVRETIHYH